MKNTDKFAYETKSQSLGASLGKFVYKELTSGYKVTCPDGRTCGIYDSKEKAASVACYQANKQIATLDYYRTMDFDCYAKKIDELRLHFGVRENEDTTHTFVSSKEPRGMLSHLPALSGCLNPNNLSMQCCAFEAINTNIIFSSGKESVEGFSQYIKTTDWKTSNSVIQDSDLMYDVY